MMLCVVGDSHHVDSWAAYAPVIDILVGEVFIHGITEMAQHFIYDLTCDIIGEAGVNETWFPFTNLLEKPLEMCKSDQYLISEIKGGGKNSPPPLQ